VRRTYRLETSTAKQAYEADCIRSLSTRDSVAEDATGEVRAKVDACRLSAGPERQTRQCTFGRRSRGGNARCRAKRTGLLERRRLLNVRWLATTLLMHSTTLSELVLDRRMLGRCSDRGSARRRHRPLVFVIGYLDDDGLGGHDRETRLS
jgi:hypothetical protein